VRLEKMREIAAFGLLARRIHSFAAFRPVAVAMAVGSM
jgi:hypothetical protein